MAALTLTQANQILTAALAKSREAGYKPMGIAVLDDAGNLKAFASEDGASMFRFDIARAKAWGAVGMGGVQPRAGQRAKDNPNFFVSLAATADGKFLPQPGAVVIKDAKAGDRRRRGQRRHRRRGRGDLHGGRRRRRGWPTAEVRWDPGVLLDRVGGPC